MASGDWPRTDKIAVARLLGGQPLRRKSPVAVDQLLRERDHGQRHNHMRQAVTSLSIGQMKCYRVGLKMAEGMSP